MRIRVDGMSCGHCAGSVRKALEALRPGLEAHVDLDASQVELASVDLPGEDELRQAVEKAGFVYGGRVDG